ncbi:MAG: hypothetical protein Q8L77_07020 [Nitrospirota bacterium]|nr:hypothetical protein [Nitrospirota bacterium]
MPIDYSQSGYKEMFANYGLTVIAALSLEKSLLLLTSAIGNLSNGSLPKEKLHEYLESSQSKPPMKKKTMGSLVNEVKMRINIPASLETDLEKAKEMRNHIIHHFFMDEYETLSLETGAIVLSNKLRPVRDFFLVVQSEVDRLLLVFCSELRKPKNEIGQEVRRMLKGKWAI